MSDLLFVRSSSHSCNANQQPLTDYRRKDLGEQAKEKITPDSQKSTLDKASESVTGAGDKLASAVQPGKLVSQLCSSETSY